MTERQRGEETICFLRLFLSGIPVDMYTEDTQTTGHHRFLQNNNSTIDAHWPRHQRGQREPPYGYLGGPRIQPASGQQLDRPATDFGKDVPSPRLKDGGLTVLMVDGEVRNGCRRPQSRTEIVGLGPDCRAHHRNLVYPWEMNPGRWNYPLETGPPVRGQCDCVTRIPPFHVGIPHPLPHLQVKGQGLELRRTVSYVCLEQQGGCSAEDYHWDPHNPPPGGLTLNGHCGPTSGFSGGGRETETYQDRGKVRGGSEEGSNGCAAHRNDFFPTEVPQNHLNQKRRARACVPPDSSQALQIQHRTRQDSVRDQIRQVVTDLEDVLGGLKRVHTEMKEVMEQIDRLTAGIHLGHEASCATRASSKKIHSSGLSGELPLASLPNHRSALSEAPRHVDEGHVILQTNSPSPIHMASVVKTRRFTPPSLIRDVNQEKPGANGHPPHLHPLRDSAHIGLTWSEPRPYTMDPEVIIRSSTNKPRTHKPPLYPENGRCGKGLLSPAKSECRSPPCNGRGLQNSSVV